MERHEYSRISTNEESHFWYKANREFSIDLLENHCHLSGTNHILDAGCGVGGTTVALKKYGHVTGIDIHPLAIKFSGKYTIDRLIKADVNKLPFKRDSFDLVTSFDVLYHKDVDPTKAMAEMYRVLKPGGWVLIRFPAFEFLRGGHDLVVQTGRRFTASQLAKLIRTVGFKINYLSYFNLVLFLPSLIWRNTKSKSSSDVIKLWPPLNFLLYIMLKIESKFALNINLPFGTSVYCLAQKI